MENTIKLSSYIKTNKPYILRNVFFKYVNSNILDINTHLEHIRTNVFNNSIECDINLTNALNELKYYIERNILNYSEIKKVLKFDIKNTIPKPKFKEYLNNSLNSQYHINNILGAI